MLSQQHPLSLSTVSPFFIKILYYFQDLIQVSPLKKMSIPSPRLVYFQVILICCLLA